MKINLVMKNKLEKNGKESKSCQNSVQKSK